MDSIRISLFFVSLICNLLLPEVNPQMQACSFEGLDLSQCFDQGHNPASSLSCCRALNQAVEAGHRCLCLLLPPSGPLPNIPFLLPLSNCYISIPPLSQCQDPFKMLQPPAIPIQVPNHEPDAPLTVPLPPEIPKELSQPSEPNDLPVPLPPGEAQTPVISTPAVESQQPLLPETIGLTSNGGDTSSSLLRPRFLLVVTLCILST